MTKRKFTLFFSLFLVLFLGFIPLNSNATHIVGGEMNYTCLGNDQYEITLVIYRDCYNGNPNAWFDDPASIGVFDANNNLVTEILVPLNPMLNDTLDAVLANDCLVAPADVCVHTTTYTTVATLPFIVGGYQLAYQRCCRNQTIVNIVEPLATGATYGVTISEKALLECNSNAKFNVLPPLFICVNEPISFDQSAFDIDGDSIVYKLCTPLEGASPDLPRPQPPNNPPYAEIVWVDPPYNVDNMLNGLPGGQALSINASTGLLTGLPNTIGQFVVGICIEEYRNGELISTTRRDFQYNVGVCGQSSAAFFAPEIQCNDLTVIFENQSQEANRYLWFFNDPNNPNATSIATNPTYTYSAPGLYEVMLVADPNTICADTFSRIINLSFSNLDINVAIETMDCLDSYEIILTDLSTDDLSTPTTWLWEILGTGLISTEQHPSFNLMGIAPGNYTLQATITVENGCSSTESFAITVTEPLSVHTTSVDPLCHGDTNGRATINVTGGTPPYIYLWNNGETSSEITNLGEGAYSVTVTTANNCQIIENFVLSVAEAVSSSIAISYSSCEALQSGIAVVTPQGGLPPYTYLWSNGETSSTLSNVSAGTYTVTVSDANGCTSTEEVTLLENGGISATITTTHVTCHGGNDGSIDLEVVGGFGAYTYAWSSGQNTPNLNDLQAGTYTITVTDSGGCNTIETITIVQNQALNLTILAMEAGCLTDTALGTACAGVLGGLPPYTYVWDNGATTAMLQNLSVGTYQVTATDANGCTVVGTAGIAFYNFEVEINSSPIACNGELAALATAVIIGGEAPYEYLWNDESTGPSLSDLSPGTYAVTVSDVMGCTTSTTELISEPDVLSINVTPTNISCNGAADGVINVLVMGGTSPYSYVWSNDATTATVGNLQIGVYEVTVTDANGCTTNGAASIDEPTALNVSLSAPLSVCRSDADATITSSVSGGTLPYTYLWSNGATTSALANLIGGDFSLTVTDAHGCEATATASIATLESPSCSISVLQSIVSVNGDEGQLQVNISGGLMPYDFTWSNGATDLIISNLTADTYTVSVTDANACSSTCQVTLVAPPPALIGDFVWNDFNRNGLQDPNELGIPNVFVNMEGTNIFGENILTATYTGPRGEYLFGNLNAGSYRLTFEIPDGYQYAPNNEGNDDSIDNDISAENPTTMDIIVDFGESNVTIDAGFYRNCENVTHAGTIGDDQFLCFAGDNPEPIVSITAPAGGQGDIEIMWMQSAHLVAFSSNSWSIIPGATGLSYDPGPLSETTYFARCVRSAGCENFEEANVVKITVGTGAISSIVGPEEVCINEVESYAAGLSGTNITYAWNFGTGATPATSNLQFVNVAWNSLGLKTISLTVTEQGCSTVVHKTIRVTDSQAVCGGLALPSPTTASTLSVYPNPLQGKVSVVSAKPFETDRMVEIMDIHGQKINQVNWRSGTYELLLDLTNYPAGVYYLNVSDGGVLPTLLRLVKL